jgi:CheY-like chemotaxis protein
MDAKLKWGLERMEKDRQKKKGEVGSVRILIVDDIKMNLKLAETVLHNRMSCETLLAGSGRECLTVLAEHEDIDLILLDIAMPELDGMQTLKLIRKVDRLKHIPVMFLTADGDPLTVIKANEFHADDYIRKPIRADDLIQRVSRILQLRKMKKMME